MLLPQSGRPQPPDMLWPKRLPGWRKTDTPRFQKTGGEARHLREAQQGRGGASSRASGPFDLHTSPDADQSRGDRPVRLPRTSGRPKRRRTITANNGKEFARFACSAGAIDPLRQPSRLHAPVAHVVKCVFVRDAEGAGRSTRPHRIPDADKKRLICKR